MRTRPGIRFHTLWLRWSSILAGLLIMQALLAGVLAERVADTLAAPELEQTTQSIGDALAHQIERALGYRIPIDGLVGVDDWLAGIVRANRLLKAINMTDTAGRPLANYGTEPAALAVLRNVRSEQSQTIAGVYFKTIPLHGTGGTVVGWLHVGSAAPAIGAGAWLWPLLAALLATALGALALYVLLRWRCSAPLAQSRSAVNQLAALPEEAAGPLPVLHTLPARDAAAQLNNALAERLHALRRRYATLSLKIAEARAAHFDAEVLQALERLAEPFSELATAGAVPAAAGTDDGSGIGAMASRSADAIRPPSGSAARRALLATGFILVVAALCAWGIQAVYRQAAAQRLVDADTMTLQQAWRATLEEDQVHLDAKLQTLLASPELDAAFGTNDTSSVQRQHAEKALQARLEEQANGAVTLAVFDLDGATLASSAPDREIVRLDALALDPLRLGAATAHGVWQNAALIYQSGVARRVSLPSGRAVIAMAAQPLDVSLNDLGRRLGVPTAAADLRGQPLNRDSAAQVDAWNRAARHNTVLPGGGAVVALPLVAPSGHAIATLLATFPVPAQFDFGHRLLLIALLLLAGAAALFLLLYLPATFAPFLDTVHTLERLVEGETDIDLETAPSSGAPTREAWRTQRAVVRLAEKIEALEALKRARERQGRRQARFIRLQMLQLADRLDEAARRGILEDLERIEHARQPVVEPRLDDPRLERMVDEFGILALGFQNLVSRVGEQYQELDRLVRELREALRAKTQFIALQQELEIARKMQLSILPRQFDAIAGLEIRAAMVPAREVGGDFYDFFRLDAHRVGLVMADVSGKGVPAAFFMAISRTLLRAIAQFNDNPATCLARVNDLLAEDNEEMMFVTLFYAILDTDDGVLQFANAGHNLPVLIRADGRIETVPATRGIALAVADGFAFELGRLELAPGDGIFLYTDGITEAADPDGMLYGEQRLQTALQTLRELPVAQIPARMVEYIKAFEAGGAQADDITCLMARYRRRAS
jgi:serine phosphatase RsbU (regulator of sigma subunit)